MLARLLAAGVGVVILFAGATKITGREEWKRQATAQSLWPVVVVTLPLAELVIGALLIVLKPHVLVLGVATLLLLIFTTYLFVMVATKSTVPCACFGARVTRPPSWRDIFRNVGLLLALFVSAAVS